MNHGTQIPYIKKALELGFDIIITNTNDITGATNDITGDIFSPIDHANAVFRKFVIPARPRSVAIVAHSYGAFITAALVN